VVAFLDKLTNNRLQNVACIKYVLVVRLQELQPVNSAGWRCREQVRTIAFNALMGITLVCSASSARQSLDHATYQLRQRGGFHSACSASSSALASAAD
jgi:hypothetical protein